MKKQKHLLNLYKYFGTIQCKQIFYMNNNGTTDNCTNQKDKNY